MNLQCICRFDRISLFKTVKKNSWSIFSLGNFVLTESFKLNFLAADWLGSPRECFIMMWHISLCQWHLLWSMCPVWDSAMLCHNIQPSVTTFKCGLQHSLTHLRYVRHCKDLEKERNFVLDKYCDFYFSWKYNQPNVMERVLLQRHCQTQFWFSFQTYMESNQGLTLGDDACIWFYIFLFI